MLKSSSPRLFRGTIAAFIAVAAACGGSATVDSGTAIKTPTSPTGKTDSSTGPTSAGAVAGVTLTIHALTVRLGGYAQLLALPRDANGVWIPGKHVTYTSGNSAIVTAADSGIIFAKALGTVWVYASVDGKSDSASIAVIPASDTALTPQPVPPPAYDLSMTVVGGIAGADSSHAQVVPGATVTLTRYADVRGDSTSGPVAAGMVLTDANGKASVKAVPNGYVSVVVTPPVGSVYHRFTFTLRPQPVTSLYITISIP